MRKNNYILSPDCWADRIKKYVNEDAWQHVSAILIWDLSLFCDRWQLAPLDELFFKEKHNFNYISNTRLIIELSKIGYEEPEKRICIYE